MQSILITGGCGFIGSHACISFLNKGYNLYIIDSNRNSSSAVLDKICEIGLLSNNNYSKRLNFIKGDIRNEELVNFAFLEAKKNNEPIAAVIHFAGLKSVKESVFEPLLYWENNVWGTITLLKVMKKFSCFNIVFSSSATVYGDKNLESLKENLLPTPANPYGETKLVVEKILSNLHKSSENCWRIANLRYFNPIGAHESGMIGENSLNVPDNLFPYICKVAEGSLKKLNIYGNDWPTPDGTCIRDFIHVMDLADAHLSTLEFLLENRPQIKNINIGTGKGTSVLELVNTFISINDCKLEYTFSKRRSGDVPILVADNKLALSTLNWEPKRDLKQMCKDGWRWQKLNPNGYK